MEIRIFEEEDFEQVWQIFHPIVSAGTTYTFDQNTNRAEARRVWLNAPLETWVALENGVILGTYFIKPNQGGGGAHVCNCGYMVAQNARGKGIARKMCEHSQMRAQQLGFKAMQFNFVVSTNLGAIALWKKLGFAEVGRLPKAFDHPQDGYVDAFVMYKDLDAG